MIGMKRTAVSILVSLILVGTAVASVWLMASAGVFTGGGAGLPGAPAAVVTIASARAGSVSVAPGLQVAQPRDPFEPLITTPGGGDGGETTTTGAGGTTTTGAGGTTTTVAGGTTTTGAGTTTTTQGDGPDGIRVKLLEVRNEASGRVAVVEVDGIAYTVKVGDTFATTFKVVSLTNNGGVFTYGDSAFSLAVGQSILK
jgi:hypothetical protein